MLVAAEALRARLQCLSVSIPPAVPRRFSIVESADTLSDDFEVFLCDCACARACARARARARACTCVCTCARACPSACAWTCVVYTNHTCLN